MTAVPGCVLPPKDEPRVNTIAGTSLGLDGVPAPAVPDGWWTTFKDPQLDALIEKVFASNPTLAEALARVRVAEAQIRAARAVARPGFTFDGQASRERFAEHFIYPPPFAGGEYWQGQLGVDLNWNLDFWGRQAALIEQAKSATQAAALDAAAARLAVSGLLAQAYVELYRADVFADIATQAEQQRQRILDITRKRLAAGLDSNVDLRQAEAAVPQARLARLQAQASAELAVHELAAMAGEGAASYPDFVRPVTDLEAALPVPEQLPADLLARRPDVLAAKARVEAALAGRQAAHQAFYPDVNLSAFAGFAAIGLDNLLRTDDAVYGGGPAVHLPLFESGSLKSRYHAATAELDSAIAIYNETVLNAVQQTADQLSLLRSYTQQLAQSRQTLTASEEAYRLAERRYDAGLDNYLNVLNAETRVLDARRGYISVLSAQATARVGLLLALGGSFDPAHPLPAEGASAPVSTARSSGHE
jgi:NodT family efflux transporter outer membrane factor (OMF) lipoprotein